MRLLACVVAVLVVGSWTPATADAGWKVDRALAIADVVWYGRITEAGTHDELVAADGRDAELFSLQAAAYRE
jgi:hypothetical protein